MEDLKKLIEEIFEKEEDLKLWLSTVERERLIENQMLEEEFEERITEAEPFVPEPEDIITNVYDPSSNVTWHGAKLF